MTFLRDLLKIKTPPLFAEELHMNSGYSKLFYHKLQDSVV